MLSFKELLLAVSAFGLINELHAETAVTQQSATKEITTKSNKPHLKAEQKLGLKPELAAVPFFFSSENLSTAFGGAAVIKHAGQPQSSALGIGLYTTNDSWVGYMSFNNYQLPKGIAPQWLFGLEHYQAFYKEGTYFINDADRKAQSMNQRIITQGDESFSKLHLEYVLPIGKGVNGAAASLRPSKQKVNWNPLTSGVSTVTFTPFMQSQALLIATSEPSQTKGLEISFDWDNRDNGKNSSDGGQTNLKIRNGFSDDEAPSWTTWSFEQSAFFSIGKNDFFRQQILATHFYLADTPTWNSQSGEDDYHRPPSYAGVSLGGYEQLRGYSTKRFTGRSALLYTLEYRVQPHWQPLQEWPIFNFYDVPWWQWVVFAEVGNVSDSFSISALHQDMEWSLGAGARFEVESVVIRAELGVSDESNQFWVMVSQPF